MGIEPIPGVREVAGGDRDAFDHVRLSKQPRHEGRSMAQICEAFLRVGSETYKKEGAKVLQRFLAQRRQKTGLRQRAEFPREVEAFFER